MPRVRRGVRRSIGTTRPHCCLYFGPPTQRIKHLIPSSLVTRIVIVTLLLLMAITSILSYVVVSEDFAEEQANDAPEGERQTARLLGRALSQLRQKERWMPAIARIEQEAVEQCLGANRAIC